VSWSHMHAAQKSKSAFLEISEQSAATARLVQEVRQEQPAQAPVPKRSLVHQAASWCDHLLKRFRKSIVPHPGEARG
jgi:hypothetical protein